MRKEDMLGKITEIKEGLEELEEMAQAGTDKGNAEQNVFHMSLADAAGLLRAGFGYLFHVGDVIVSKHADAGRIAWNVIGKCHDRDPENPDKPTLTLLMRDVLPERWVYSEATKEYRWGHAHWPTSDIRKKLNGDFLGGFTHEDQADMIAVEKTTYAAGPDGGQPEITKDKLFLLSCTEAGFPVSDYVRNEGEAYPFFTGDESRRKVDCEGNARYWWLRSPVPGSVYDPRSVYTSGALSDYYDASHGHGAAAACVIG